ncbi:esterase [Vibrio sp. 10N.286.49.C2]|uniref:hotdog fold thioesterase n=1 Tax=unclassified Vibrio TaxID=2614977 RepID=UPI000C81A893|nr:MULTISPECIES: hotdog fold thioesterase [unclassified Vibrio]PMH34778.1 esterase [Vibrio sp. 10N.286.49.C2]PMH51433.1 esterase [Vibrio sp. 10N.286.49.B1]PMH79371.1 esterase [Vibrio sp. 10N.286.48.B7]
MSIWKKKLSLAALNRTSENTLIEHLQIEYTAFSDNSLSATMPVCSFTHQPLGMLHGGASVVLAETLGSLAANYCVDENHYCVGLDINANHVRAMRSGIVIGTATPIHLGVSTQVWQIDITDSKQRLVCTSRLTIAVKKHKKATA